jgi:hypothetical protein
MKDDAFCEAVRTMPFVEADEELRARRHDALLEKAEALERGDGAAAAMADWRINRVKDELHRLNRINRDFQIQLAVRALFGEDGWGQVKVWLCENAPEAT